MDFLSFLVMKRKVLEKTLNEFLNYCILPRFFYVPHICAGLVTNSVVSQ